MVEARRTENGHLHPAHAVESDAKAQHKHSVLIDVIFLEEKLNDETDDDRDQQHTA
ncbi:MAG: hypothetical protein OER22_12075 [Gammaproteobacteria bacterium]|nr:hypothetical protein [Gammaproteobacteria bacterium]MDH3407919.1 hypothetical protein [Gammaproteobacteria bacterium]MDH3553345.1 hypothetical protein [Gammaproteobacteria bacterium]